MKKLLLTMVASVATAGAMADVTSTFVTRNFTLLKADQLNAVTATQRFAIECTQETNYNTLYNGSGRTGAINSTVMAENVVYEWVKVDGEDNFYIKKAGSEEYLATNNITTFVAKTADNVAKFKALAVNVNDNIANSFYNTVEDKECSVRLALAPNHTTWFNFNAGVLGYNAGTGVWTVQHVLDLSEYYKLTMTIKKGEETTTSVVYMKTGEDIVAPDYTSEGYETDYVSTKKTADDAETVTIVYTLNAKKMLQALIDQAKTYEGGDLVGEYSTASVEALKSAIAVAEGKLEGDVTEEDVTTLQAAIDGLKRNMPVAGKFYQMAAWKTGNEGKVAFANNENKCYWGLNETPAAVWVFEDAGEGNYYLKNLATGSYMDNYSGSAGGANVLIAKDETKKVSVVAANDGRKVGIKVGGNQFLDRDQYNPDANGCKPVCHWEDNATVVGGENRQWLVNEVNATDIKHTLSVSEAGWATLVLGFNATIPADAEVYVVESTSATSATLKLVTGVLPANKAVLVKAAANSTVEFAYTAEEASVSTLLEGTLYDKNITPEDGKTCYVLANKDNVVGFYQVELTDNAFKNGANKAYLAVAASEAPALNFVFGETDGISGVSATKTGNAIYDLSGRRVKAATKGIFIVNGKKIVK